MANLNTVKKELFLSDDETSDSSSSNTPLSTGSYSSSHTASTRRSRVSFDKQITDMLIETFSKCQYPDFTERTALADKAGVSESRIQVWYQNRRTRLRRKNHVINKPSNLPGPRVRLNGSFSLSSPVSTKPAPLACVVQPQPRKISEETKEQVAPIMIKPILHSVDNILNTRSADKRKLHSDDLDNQEQPLDLTMHSTKRQHLDMLNTSTPTMGPFPWFPMTSFFPFSPFAPFPIVQMTEGSVGQGVTPDPSKILPGRPQDSGYNSNENDSF